MFFFIDSGHETTAPTSLVIAFNIFSITNLFAQHNKTKEIETLMARVDQLGIFNGNVLVMEKEKTSYEASLGNVYGSKT